MLPVLTVPVSDWMAVQGRANIIYCIPDKKYMEDEGCGEVLLVWRHSVPHPAMEGDKKSGSAKNAIGIPFTIRPKRRNLVPAQWFPLPFSWGWHGKARRSMRKFPLENPPTEMRRFIMKKSLSARLDAGVAARLGTGTLVSVAVVAIAGILIVTCLSLSSSVGNLGKQIATLDDRIARLEQQGATKVTGAGNDGGGTLGQAGKKMTAVPGSGADEELQRLAGVVRASGLENAATSPEMLKEMAEKYSVQKKVAAYREQLVKRNADLHSLDATRYGPRVAALYEQAKGRGPGASGGGGAAADPASDAALQALVEEFPQSNATGIAIAQRALQSAMQGNAADVEKYYNSLSQDGTFAGVVTDRGVEAMPTIQLYLAASYLRENRVSEAQALLQSVEQNYPQSAIPVPAPGGQQGGQQNWQPVTTITQGMRKQIESGQTSRPPPPK